MSVHSIFLRIITVFMALIAIGICFFVLPFILSGFVEIRPELEWYGYIAVVMLYISALLVLNASYLVFRLIGEFNKEEFMISRFKMIQWNALGVAVCSLIATPMFFIIGDFDDAPGVMLVSILYTGGALVVYSVMHLIYKRLKG